MPVQKPTLSPKRIRILGEEEVRALYALPNFTHEERLEYFSLSPAEEVVLNHLHSIKSRVYFILQLGYFKSHHLFFLFTLSDVQEDVRYIQQQWFPDASLTDLHITKVTRFKQRSIILQLCHYRYCGATHRRQLAAKARQVARISAKPTYIFRELFHLLKEHRLVAPGYSVIQDIVGKALAYEQSRLATIVSNALHQQEQDALDCLVQDVPGLYEVTQLRREPRDFGTKEVKREIQREKHLRPLYRVSQRLLPQLGISNESIKYYASLVGYYSVYKLKRFPITTTYIYLLCFVYHRYQRLHDHLIHSFLHHVRRYTESAKEAAKDRVYACHVESNENLAKAGQVLKLFTDDGITPSTLFRDVQSKAFTILDRQQINFTATHMTKHARFDENAFKWEHLDKISQQFKLQLRPLLLTVDWAATSTPLLKAVRFLQAAFCKGQPLSHYATAAFPQQFIPASIKRYIYAPDKCLMPNRYEFLVYWLLRNGLEAGDIFCRDSVRFRSFEDDLLNDQQWQDKERLIKDTRLSNLSQPIREHLAGLEKQLERKLVQVNQRIASGENTHVKVMRRGTQVHWTLQYPRSGESVNHPFFGHLKQTDIDRVLHFVNQHCPFLSSFEHVLGRYAKQATDNDVLTACILAWGTNVGLGRMATISDINYQTLSAVSDNFIRLETLKDANHRVSNAICAFPIFRHYDLGGTLHSSSDGQKFETRIHTINARHSPKYFGLNKGVVSYTLVANHIPVSAYIIGAHEHESHYVFDILFNNTTDIHPTAHSTDTHGTNEVNFAILSLFNYRFAPRYRDIYGKVKKMLYGFQHPSQYPSGVLLRPIRKLSTKLIIEEWDNVQRILVSLALKTTTQSIIVRKLSAFARTNKTRRALWEYDNIIRSLYLLDYIDSPPLRSNVQRALNRGESYHQLRRAVAYANFGKLRFKTEQEQQIWGECARLLTHCIIYYNARLLSEVHQSKKAAGDRQAAAFLAQVSPIAWQHVNFYGRYEFRNRPQVIDMDAVVQQLAHTTVQQILGG